MVHLDMVAIEEGDQDEVIGAYLSCLTCKTEKSKVYDPPITYLDFVYDKPNLICPGCNAVLLSVARFDNGKGEGSGEQRQEHRNKPETKSEEKNEKEKKVKSKREFPVYKYSNRLRGDLRESIIVSDTPVFLKFVNGHYDIEGIILEDTRNLRPIEEEEYPYEPYRFRDTSEIRDYIERAMNETHDSLFTKIESVVSLYNDQQDYKLSLISADIFGSYFQDRFSTTHYDCITGGNGSGKSSLGDTYGALAYRPVNMTDPTAANLYRLLGPIEPGQCTMILEESEKIDQSQDLMSTLKTGYNLSGRVPRINMNTGNQEFFFSYCLKIIITERSPNQQVAKGVLDRVLSFTCYKGNPKRDIKEVLNPTNTGGPEHHKWLCELNDLRKLLFSYRLVHFKDPIPDIDIGIIGRDKELAKPLIQLFNETESQAGIVATLQKLLDAKNKRKEARLESVIAPLVIELISKNGFKFQHSIFWDYFKLRIPGQQDERKPNEYHTADYGTVYRNSITNILRDSFGVETKHESEGNVLIFDENIVPVLRATYADKITVMKKNEGYEGSEGYREKALLNEDNRTQGDSAFSHKPSQPSQPS